MGLGGGWEEGGRPLTAGHHSQPRPPLPSPVQLRDPAKKGRHQAGGALIWRQVGLGDVLLGRWGGRWKVGGVSRRGGKGEGRSSGPRRRATAPCRRFATPQHHAAAVHWPSRACRPSRRGLTIELACPGAGAEDAEYQETNQADECVDGLGGEGRGGGRADERGMAAGWGARAGGRGADGGLADGSHAWVGATPARVGVPPREAQLRRCIPTVGYHGVAAAGQAVRCGAARQACRPEQRACDPSTAGGWRRSAGPLSVSRTSLFSKAPHQPRSRRPTQAGTPNGAQRAQGRAGRPSTPPHPANATTYPGQADVLAGDASHGGGWAVGGSGPGDVAVYHAQACTRASPLCRQAEGRGVWAPVSRPRAGDSRLFRRASHGRGGLWGGRGHATAHLSWTHDGARAHAGAACAGEATGCWAPGGSAGWPWEVHAPWRGAAAAAGDT